MLYRSMTYNQIVFICSYLQHICTIPSPCFVDCHLLPVPLLPMLIGQVRIHADQPPDTPPKKKQCNAHRLTHSYTKHEIRWPQNWYPLSTPRLPSRLPHVWHPPLLEVRPRPWDPSLKSLYLFQPPHHEFWTGQLNHFQTWISYWKFGNWVIGNSAWHLMIPLRSRNNVTSKT